jgi:hypothetical protein
LPKSCSPTRGASVSAWARRAGQNLLEGTARLRDIRRTNPWAKITNAYGPREFIVPQENTAKLVVRLGAFAGGINWKSEQASSKTCSNI